MFLLIGISLISFVDSAKEVKGKISEEVYESLGDKEETNIIIQPKPEKRFFGIKIADVEDIKKQVIKDLDKKEDEFREYENLISLSVSEQELKELEENSNVEAVFYSHKIKAFLQDSVSLVNASQVWDEQIGSVNITGIDETICILDTGVNFSHPDLIGKNKTCTIDCLNKDCVENCSVSDDYGHGTHVAGIVGASGRIQGIAPDVGLIAVKVLDENGDGSTNAELDLVNAIDWCVENRALYNISVITMSLGTDYPYIYDDYCDSTFLGTWTKAINNATLHNISIIASSGNSYNLTHISSPACIQNATSVGASTKDDEVASYSNRNGITDLFAPGSLINSTSITGEYTLKSGTSMAAPHVAGAFALIRQFFRLNESKIITPLEILNLLNSTGKQIQDLDSGLNFSIIDIYTAINHSGDSPGDSPDSNVSVSFSLLNNTHTNQNQTNFTCNSTSNYELTNISFYLWNSTGLVYNFVQDISGISNSTNFNYSFLIEESYLWNCVVYNNQSGFNSNENYSIVYDITEPNITLITPEDSVSYTSNSQSVIFYYNFSEDYINNCSLIINEIFNLTESNLNKSLTQNFTQTFSIGDYIWKINCNDFSGNQKNSSQRNFSITATQVDSNSESSGGSGWGGSGGGGGSDSITPSIYFTSNEEILKPYTKQLKENDKIKFTSEEEHTLTLKQINIDSVNIEIQSDLINFVLKIGESKELNLSSSENDFSIKLNNIIDKKADITIQVLENPKAPANISAHTPITGKAIEFNEEITGKAKIGVILLIVMVFLIALFFRHRGITKKRAETKKEYSERFRSLVPKKMHRIGR